VEQEQSGARAERRARLGQELDKHMTPATGRRADSTGPMAPGRRRQAMDLGAQRIALAHGTSWAWRWADDARRMAGGTGHMADGAGRTAFGTWC
jgi:hypothetical protein